MRMINKKIVLGLCILCVVCIGVVVQSVNAGYPETFLGDGVRNYYIEGGLAGHMQQWVKRPQLRVIELANGKILNLYMDFISHKWHIRVVDKMGVILADVVMPDISGGHGGGAILAPLSDNEAVAVIGQKSSMGVYCFRFNSNTYSVTSTNVHISGGSGGECTENIGSYGTYNGYIYIFVQAGSYYNGQVYGFAKFKIADSTVTWVGNRAGSLSKTSEMFIWQDPLHTNALYCVVTADMHTPQYKVYDVDTNTWNDLATNPVDNRLPNNNTWNNFVTFYGGRIIVDGTYYYLTLSWCFSYALPSGVTMHSKCRVVSWTGRFNNSITGATLLSQVCKTYVFGDSAETGVSMPQLCGGYQESFEISNSHFLWTYYHDEKSGKLVTKGMLGINNIKDMAAGFDSVGYQYGVDDVEFGMKSHGDNFYKDPTKTWSYHERDDTHAYIFTGEQSQLVRYDSIISCSPPDATMLVNKVYSITWTVTKNDVLDNLGNETYRIVVDGLDQATGKISSLGTIVYQAYVISKGTHSFQFKLVDNGVIYFESEITAYSFFDSPSQPDIPTQSSFMTGYIQIFMVFLPISMFMFVPAVTLGVLGGKGGGGAGMIVGMVLGAAIGTIVGVMSGYLPVYAVWLMVLIVALGFILATKVSGSGGSM